MQPTPHFLDKQLTELDFVRLQRLSASHTTAGLADLLADADVVPGPQIAAEVITMYSQFELEDRDSGERRVLAVCYPEDAEPSSGFISVLSPLGCSLIGLPAGAQVRWQTPTGERQGLVRAVLFQPEASGDYVT
ncbi:GreA/GreB family elongation factor [Ramlibacter sp. AN1015]|uniref:GreA/GreB family elongation factor n=1 Tax=Ramlibacter sp. AN1015 TaxID=3133428 RepID=UPI0030BFB740